MSAPGLETRPPDNARMRISDRPFCGILCGLAAIVLAADPAPAAEAVVLMYHRFGEDQYPSTSIRLEQLDVQLDYLATEGFHVIPLARLLDALEHGMKLPDRSVVITVDDAYRSVYEQAYPRFRERGWPYTVFVATGPVDRGLEDFMTWDQMREMQQHGATFANHGTDHDTLIDTTGSETPDARRARIRSDLETSRARLEAELDPVANAFAYPYGEYDELSASVVEALGYIAFGQQSGAVGTGSDRRALPRYPMAEAYAAIDEFRNKVRSRPLPVVDVEPWDPVTRDTRPRIEMTLGQTDARLDRLACYVSGQGRVDVDWLADRKRFAVQPARDLGAGRSRVNCTAPVAAGDRFFWFSHPWIVVGVGD